MSIKAALAATTLIVASAPAFAQGITGGQLGVEYNAPTDGSDFGGTTYSGGLEYAITRQFSVAVDATAYNPDTLNIDGSNITAHGIYHLSDAASAGVFYGQDSLDNGDARVYGIEGGTELMGGTVEGYIGRVDGDGEDATIIGVDGAYALQQGFSVIGSADLLSFNDDASVSRASIGAQYDMPGGPQFYAHIGTISVEAAGLAADQSFIGVGARVAFGTQRGTTFDGRSSLAPVAGF